MFKLIKLSKEFDLDLVNFDLNTVLTTIIKDKIYMKVVLLAGGIGSRLSEETYLKPKPLVEIGNMPMIWHIMMSRLVINQNLRK